MKYLMFTVLLSATMLFAANNKIIIKKEFVYNNDKPSQLGADYAFYHQGKNWTDGLSGMKVFSKCKLVEIDELGKIDGKFKAKLTAECMSK